MDTSLRHIGEGGTHAGHLLVLVNTVVHCTVCNHDRLELTEIAEAWPGMVVTLELVP
ncbi:hypothetical protein KGP36_02335 [Patescibacteria group bacterium]|nr:hypothetical protein [Patescibacteria group bacterium]